MVDLIEYLENVDGQFAAFSILAIMIVQSPILTFPGYLLMIYAGFRFGLLTGTLINFMGLYTSCILGYRFGLLSSSDLSNSSNPRLRKFHKLIEDKGMNTILFLRIFPIIPNNVTSIGSGLTRVSEKKHAFYSGFSIIQSTFWSFLGSYILKNQISGLRLNVTVYHGLALAFVIVLLIYLRYRVKSINPS